MGIYAYKTYAHREGDDAMACTCRHYCCRCCCRCWLLPLPLPLLVVVRGGGVVVVVVVVVVGCYCFPYSHLLVPRAGAADDLIDKFYDAQEDVGPDSASR